MFGTTASALSSATINRLIANIDKHGHSYHYRVLATSSCSLLHKRVVAAIGSKCHAFDCSITSMVPPGAFAASKAFDSVDIVTTANIGLCLHRDWRLNSQLDWGRAIRQEARDKRLREEYAVDMAIIHGAQEAFLSPWLLDGSDQRLKECFADPFQHPALRKFVAGLCAEAWHNTAILWNTDRTQCLDRPVDVHPADASIAQRLANADVAGTTGHCVPIIIVTPPAPDNIEFESDWWILDYSRPTIRLGLGSLDRDRLRIPWKHVATGEIEPLWDYSLPDWHFEGFDDMFNEYKHVSPVAQPPSPKRIPGAQGWVPTVVPKAEGSKRSRQRRRKAAAKLEVKLGKEAPLRELLERCQTALQVSLDRREYPPDMPAMRHSSRISIAPAKDGPDGLMDPTPLDAAVTPKLSMPLGSDDVSPPPVTPARLVSYIPTYRPVPSLSSPHPVPSICGTPIAHIAKTVHCAPVNPPPSASLPELSPSLDISPSKASPPTPIATPEIRIVPPSPLISAPVPAKDPCISKKSNSGDSEWAVVNTKRGKRSGKAGGKSDSMAGNQGRQAQHFGGGLYDCLAES